jgi:SagB-type dehydrogenase family enzyme
MKSRKSMRAASIRLVFLCAALSIPAAILAGGFGARAGDAKEETMASAADTIRLPAVPAKGAISIEEAIWLRRSVRGFSEESPSVDAVSRLLWAAQGITDPKNGLRSAPSAGATYPLEIFLATGEYVARYVPDKHCLVVTMRGDMRKALVAAAFDQNWFEKAPLVFIFTAVVKRTADRYDERANLYVPVEVGCASENLMLEAAALGLGSVAVGAFAEDKVRTSLELPKGWDPYLIVPVGIPSK